MLSQLPRLVLPAAILLGAVPGKAMPLVSEVFYDATGADGGRGERSWSRLTRCDRGPCQSAE